MTIEERATLNFGVPLSSIGHLRALPGYLQALPGHLAALSGYLRALAWVAYRLNLAVSSAPAGFGGRQ